MQRMIFEKTNCPLKISNLVCPKSETNHSGKLFCRHTTSRKKDFWYQNQNGLSLKVIFSCTNQKHSIWNLPSICSYPHFPLRNDSCYTIMKLNKYSNRTKLKNVFILTLFMHGSALKNRPMNIWHITQKSSKK